MPSIRLHRLVFATASVALLLLGLIVASRASADDRDLLRESSANPYVFIILDTSGSMAWSPFCTAADAATDTEPGDGGCTSECKLGAALCGQFCPATGCIEREDEDNDGEGDPDGACVRTGNVCVQPICEDGDCWVPLNGDDPSSKLFQAKEALYQVIRNVPDVNFGFATYNQDELRMAGKQWHYKMKAGEHPAHLRSGQHFPPDGSVQVFGRTHTCDSGGDVRGFQPGTPAALNDPWAMQRILQCAQLGQAGTTDASGSRLIYVLDPSDNRKYRLQWRDRSGQTLGSQVFEATARLEQCTVSDCSSRTFLEDAHIEYELVSDFAAWDLAAKRLPPQDGFFAQGQRSDALTDNNTCAGWEPNIDTSSDDFGGYNLKYSTTTHPTFPILSAGDVIPFSWLDDHTDEILDRLAPNRLLGETNPDFRVARYFQDRHNANSILELKDSPARPLIAFGATPLGNSMANFRTFYQSFRTVAGANDPDFACRKKYVLFLTDGDDTCGGNDACVVAGALNEQENVKTYVVGFGLDADNLNPNNKLKCMAEEGDTGAPLLPKTKDALIEVLNDILGEIAEEARSFASAAVPSVQADVKDRIFLSSFTPLNNTAYWDGHLDAFLKPLPLTEDQRPDKSRKCANLPADQQSGCHLWDAGEVLLLQAPSPAEIAANNFRLGDNEDQRRVYYGLAPDLSLEAVPNGRSLLAQATDSASRQDLWDAFGLTYNMTDLALDDSPPARESLAIIERTLVEKTETVDNPSGPPTQVTYILGDIFHSNPTVVDRPDNFSEFAVNRYHDESDADGQTCTTESPGYRCFARKHEFRRKMLVVGANDGQLHLFDAGTWDETEGEFNNGTGKELFSFIPRSAMPVVAELEESSRQIFGVDGSVRVVDVFIDPQHTGGNPTEADRQWRSVAVGGLREGGSVNGGRGIELDNNKPFTSGYYALDLTQPDRLDSENKPAGGGLVPTCLINYSAANCGPVPFGAELWEFTDAVDGSPAEWGVGLDEDDNDAHDLGATWSTPVIARIGVVEAGEASERWVAIFGGGFDPENRSAPERGTWIYMVDIETGRTLYKRAVVGAVPSTPAGVDFNSDGLLDAVYVGTTAGFLYKIDLRVAPSIEPVQVQDLNNVLHDTERITAANWEPFPVFDTLAAGVRRPIFFPPTVLVVAEAGSFALVFGTGDREDLWNLSGNVENRFYVIVDENFTLGDSGLPKTEANYTILDSESSFNPTANFLLRPPTTTNHGYVITLDPNERLVAAPFSISGLTVFPTFKPQVINVSEGICARTGDSRIFTILTTSGDPVLPDEGEGVKRYFSVGESLVTPPYVDQGATGNTGTVVPRPPAETAWRDAIMDKLKELFPPRTKFANYTIEVNFLRSDTGVVRSIPVPIGVVPKNWKEF